MNQETPQQAQASWLRLRIQSWRDFETLLDRDRNRPGENVEQSRALLDGYRTLISDLSLARRILPEGRILLYLESLFVRSHEMLNKQPGNLMRRWVNLYHYEVPTLMRLMAQPLLATIALFLGSILVGWFVIDTFPELVTLIASEQMIDKVQAGELWTDGLLNIMPSSVLTLQLITNNITVSLFAFALGALYGVGTLYIIILNGLMLGGVFAFTARYQMADRLFEFIIAHGVVELSVICIAGSLGLKLGEALIRPGTRNRLQAFQKTVSDTGKVLVAATPFLILAGLIEGFISPDPDFSMLFRVSVAVVSGLLFWYLMLMGTKLPSRIRA